MRRILAIIVHNWPLKIAAVLLATLLYSGVVLSENVQTFGGSVPIQPFRQPSNAVIVGNLPSVTNVRYVAPRDVAGRLSRDGFRATIDLSSASPTPDNPFVTVRVDLQYADDRVRILDYSPQVISVQLDPLVAKTVPVSVDQGPVPSGLQAGTPILSATSVEVSGPDSVVRQVAAAQARVLIQPSAIDVDQDVPLVAVDQLGNEVGPADLKPDQVHVTIRVTGLTATKTVPVTPVLTGRPADGYEIVSIDVSPSVVTLSGDADALAAVTQVATSGVSVGGARNDVAATAPIAPPAGIESISGSDVRVTVRVRAVRASRTFAIGIRLTGARSDRTYALSTPQVSATLGGTVSVLDGLAASSLVAIADVGGLSLGDHTVRLAFRPPAGTSLVSLAPATVVVTVAAPPPAPTATPVPTVAPSGP
ncbi:MAG TPA: CdaR family protein [Candidatus Limnocylindrales bacterium]|nr:CdaR family protein [Candidatus Limnocylindrales bacterium]